MTEKRWQELMNRELDGANSPEESAALRSHLAASEEGRRQFDELGRMARMFTEAGDVKPPASMEAKIIDAIASREALAGRDRGFFLDFLSPRRKIAYAFATGLAVGIIIFIILYQALSGGNQLDVRDLYGALAEREQSGAVIDAQSAAIALPGCIGTAIVQYRDQAVFVSASVEADDGVEIEIAPGAELALRSFRAPACGPYALRASGAGIAVSLGGRCEFVAVFGDAGGARPPVRISVAGAGGTLFEQTIELGRN
jgi:hypothetical protein